jgi:hypothetical protein
MKQIAALVVMAFLGLASAFALASNSSATHPTTTQTTGGGHTPVTICHKPGTPAEQELTVDDDSTELTGHLGHGDTIGSCPTQTTTGTTQTEPTTTETTTTTETVTTTTPPSDCPPGMVHERGHDGNEGNNDCCFPGVNCDGDTPTTPNDSTTISTETAQPPTEPVTTTEDPTTDEGPPLVCRPGTHEENGKCVGNEAPASKPPTAKPKHPKPPKGAPPSAPPPCPPGKPYAGPCGVEGQG